MRMPSFKLLIPLLVLGGLPVSASPYQNPAIKGIVTEESTRNPVQGASISVGGAEGKDEAISDDTGFFRIPVADSIRAGELVRLHVEKKGYTPIDRNVPLSEDILQLRLKVPAAGTKSSANNKSQPGHSATPPPAANSYVPPESFARDLQGDAAKAFELMNQSFDLGVEDCLSVVLAHDKVIRINLLVARTPKERIAVYRTALDDAKKLEAKVQEMYKLGAVSVNPVYLTRLHRSEIEFMLAREESAGR